MKKQANIPESIQHLVNPANVGLFAGTWAAGDYTLNKLRALGQSHSPTLFATAYQNAREGKQINLHTQGMLQNVLGRKVAGPMDDGRKLGTYMARRGFSPEEEARYLGLLNDASQKAVREDFIGGMADVKNVPGKGVPSYASELDQFVRGGNLDDRLARKIVGIKPNAIGKQRDVTHLVPDAALAATAPFTDFRMATRPLVRRLDETKVGRKIDGALQNETGNRPVDATKKTLRVVKDYIS